MVDPLLVLLAGDGQLLCQPDHLLLDELKVLMLIIIYDINHNDDNDEDTNHNGDHDSFHY